MTSPLEAPASGRRWGWMESSYVEPTAAKRYVATDVKCPECGSGPGVACPGERVHASRIQECLRLSRSGQLPEAPPAEVIEPTPASSCDQCGVKVNQRGHAVACDEPSHRCARNLTTGRRCSRVAEVGRYCESHVPPQQRWTDNALAPSKRWN